MSEYHCVQRQHEERDVPALCVGILGVIFSILKVTFMSCLVAPCVYISKGYVLP